MQFTDHDADEKVVMVLIWSFDVLHICLPGPPVSMTNIGGEEIEGLPFVIKSINCKCTNFNVPVSENVPVDDPNNSVYSFVNSSDEEVDSISIQSTESSGEDAKPSLFSKEIWCAGSSFDKYKDTVYKLRSCQEDDLPVELQIVKEKDNPVDRNALLFQVLFCNKWEPFGYVPCSQIPKVTYAMNNKQIVDVNLQLVKLRKSKYVVFVNIVKKGNWKKDEKSCTYNCDLSVYGC